MLAQERCSQPCWSGGYYIRATFQLPIFYTRHLCIFQRRYWWWFVGTLKYVTVLFFKWVCCTECNWSVHIISVFLMVLQHCTHTYCPTLCWALSRPGCCTVQYCVLLCCGDLLWSLLAWKEVVYCVLFFCCIITEHHAALWPSPPSPMHSVV